MGIGYMTSMEALRIIDQLISQINMNREGWKKVEEALEVIKKLVGEKENGKNT